MEPFHDLPAPTSESTRLPPGDPPSSLPPLPPAPAPEPTPPPTSPSEPAFDRPRVALGRMMITAAAMAHLDPTEVLACLRRHVRGDWGEVDTDDRESNERALRHGGRVLSAYTTSQGQRFWIITEWDQSLTTVLLPEDY